MKRLLYSLGAALMLCAAAAAPALADSTGTPGPPSQSCQDLGLTTPGNAASSPGSPFNEPLGSNPGGTGGQHYNAMSQYDVACFQQSVH
ncbi:hypothetical protein RBS60_04805 [Sinomonas sp. ASV486]|uniref:hypothetical protein n=1 Tax=Sinomonas sp. ASV486 TaxID=3051170 RepID=UPI0027DC6948|nr:hypothetical protein [Sinomonas sp. ASV486]MDQ4489517.1 hypothetical protein [Sinomonas sp. ASV486]